MVVLTSFIANCFINNYEKNEEVTDFNKQAIAVYLKIATAKI